MNDNSDDNGYEMSPHVAAMIEDGGDEEATARAIIADIFTQRIKSHHRDAMDSARFGDAMPAFMERAPMLITTIVTVDKDFSIERVQRITDDIVHLDADTFCRRYGLLDLLAVLNGREEQDKPEPYQALARHLDPGDPEAGARQIDLAILDYERARARNRNLWFALRRLTLPALSLALSGLGLHCVRALFSADLEDLSNPAVVLLTSAIRFLPLSACALLLALSIGAIYLDLRNSDDSFTPPPLPAPIAAWFEANGREQSLSSWYLLYWSAKKVRAHRRTILGFILWRRTLCPPEHYPVIEYRDDPHWAWLRSEQGKAADRIWRAPLEDRIEAWERLCFRLTLGAWAVVVAASFLPILVPMPFAPVWRIVPVLLFMALSFCLAGNALPPLRWMPRCVRAWWLRDLPPEAKEYRDHAVSVYA